MKQRLFRKRRLGVALIAGVTALGAAATIGEGVAAAATPTVVAAAATPVGTVLATQTAAPGSALTLTISGTITAGDSIILTTSCSSTLVFAGSSSISTGWAAAASHASTCASNNELVITPTTVPTTTTTTLSVTPTYTATGATAGAVALTGSYVSASGTTTFTVPSDATVEAVTVTAQTPLSKVGLATTNQAIGNITLTSPTATAIQSAQYVCLTLSANTFDATSGQPTVTQTNGAATTSGGTLVTAGTATVVGGTTGTSISFLVTGTAVSTPPTFVLSNLHADGVTAGPVTGTVSTSSSATCGTPTALGSGVVFTVGAVTAPIYGQNADDTTAAAFNAAFVKQAASGNTVTYTCGNNGNAVLATDAKPYDSLSAAYLEGELHTGVLITSPTALSAATASELKMAGVQRVYVVGGNLAVSPAVITAIQALPAYTCGGLAPTGSNIQVYSGISGQTADETAVAIANYITSTPQIPLAINTAYPDMAKYNTTTGSASTAGPTTTANTAILVSDTDYRDAAAIAGLSWAYHVPIVLTTPTALSATASAELVKLGVNQVIVVGGQLALPNAVVTSVQALNGGVSVFRIAGADYTSTAANLASFEGTVLGWANSTVYVAQGQGWSDSLGAAALVGGATPGSVSPSTTATMGAILLTEGPTKGVGQYTDAALKTAGTSPLGLGGGVTTSIQVLGGPLAVTAAQITEMDNALAAG